MHMCHVYVCVSEAVAYGHGSAMEMCGSEDNLGCKLKAHLKKGLLFTAA